jgi:adenosylmethionine-8-amino-7-oxononanoate aminotransferase
MRSPKWFEAGEQHVWRPYCQMKTARPPLAVARTSGSTIELEDGRALIDGIASWWTACHGYNHPHIAAAITDQLSRMPHVMFGGLAHSPAYTLARRLASLLPGDLDHVFFAESGSVSVEIAMKMAIQYWINRGVGGKTKFVSFLGGYHGDTLATMSVCDPDEGMHSLFKGVTTEQHVVALPVDEEKALALSAMLERQGREIAAILVEPLVQGAGGMRMYEPSVLQTLRKLADQHGILLIFDEIFTGFGRTGTMFAMQQADVVPDIVTLSKALTGGTLPLSAAIASRRVFDAFWSNDPGAALMHGPTYMANPLACAAANASLDLFRTGAWRFQVAQISAQLRTELEPCRGMPGVKDVRVMGAIGVVEMHDGVDSTVMSERFAAEGVWIRPFGHIIYLTPAFTIAPEELATLTSAIVRVLGRRAAAAAR